MPLTYSITAYITPVTRDRSAVNSITPSLITSPFISTYTLTASFTPLIYTPIISLTAFIYIFSTSFTPLITPVKDIPKYIFIIYKIDIRVVGLISLIVIIPIRTAIGSPFKYSLNAFNLRSTPLTKKKKKNISI